uniref:Trehalase n=1 Tax=Parascaris equorum TaxID=6256 RepID=A0A914R3C4_PAREQ
MVMGIDFDFVGNLRRYPIDPPACWEKYDIRYDDGRPGTGGEYPVQQGFGWTNGAVLDMILNFHTGTDKQFRLSSEGYFVIVFYCSFV